MATQGILFKRAEESKTAPEKCVPLIVDVDTFSVFEALRWKRWNFYRKEGSHARHFSDERRRAVVFLSVVLHNLSIVHISFTFLHFACVIELF